MRLTLHRACCAAVKVASKSSHFTTGTRFKACATTRNELVNWAQEHVQQSVRLCPECSPDSPAPVQPLRRSPLLPQILEYVLDVGGDPFR